MPARCKMLSIFIARPIHAFVHICNSFRKLPKDETIIFAIGLINLALGICVLSDKLHETVEHFTLSLRLVENSDGGV